MQFLFDLLYPPRCPLCDEIQLKRKLCHDCLNSLNFLEADFTAPYLDRVWFNRARSCVSYEGKVVEAIHALKYSLRFDLLYFFGDLLMEQLNEMDSYDLVLPVPLHWKRLWRRGYNPSALLARFVSKKAGVKINYFTLKKKRNISPQVGLGREDRLANVKDAWDIDEKYLPHLRGSKILLIDDVLTTGATANECSKVLIKKAKCCLVDVLTIARTT